MYVCVYITKCVELHSINPKNNPQIRFGCIKLAKFL